MTDTKLREQLTDELARRMADRIGHGMREKVEIHAETAVEWIYTDLFRVFDTIGRLLQSGWYVKDQDGKLWLFDPHGEGVACGETFRDLCLCIIFTGL
jgi:hypothetical protein